MKKDTSLLHYSLIIFCTFLLFSVALYHGYFFIFPYLEKALDTDSKTLTDSTKIFFSFIPPIITGSIASLTALFLFHKGTKRIDEKKELIDFHKKYIEIKNEISKCLIEMNFQGDDPQRKKANLLQMAYLFSKTINLLFEECLSAKGNDLVKDKLVGEDGWLRSMSNELAEILISIEKFYPIPDSNLIQHFEEALKKSFPVTHDRFKNQESYNLESFFKDRLILEIPLFQKFNLFFEVSFKNLGTPLAWHLMSPLSGVLTVSISDENQKNQETTKPDFAKEVFELQQIYQFKFGEVAKTIPTPAKPASEVNGIKDDFDNLISLTKQMVISQKSIDDKISTYNRQNPQKKAR